MLIEIDFSSDEAIYQQLCNQIILGIATSRISDGEVLPSVRQMADEIGINRRALSKWTEGAAHSYLWMTRTESAHCVSSKRS